jgi:hypothetical protein
MAEGYNEIVELMSPCASRIDAGLEALGRRDIVACAKLIEQCGYIG